LDIFLAQGPEKLGTLERSYWARKDPVLTNKKLGGEGIFWNPVSQRRWDAWSRIIGRCLYLFGPPNVQLCAKAVAW